jgi:hypothetical protein
MESDPCFGGKYLEWRENTAASINICCCLRFPPTSNVSCRTLNRPDTQFYGRVYLLFKVLLGFHLMHPAENRKHILPGNVVYLRLLFISSSSTSHFQPRLVTITTNLSFERQNAALCDFWPKSIFIYRNCTRERAQLILLRSFSE